TGEGWHITIRISFYPSFTEPIDEIFLSCCILEPVSHYRPGFLHGLFFSLFPAAPGDPVPVLRQPPGGAHPAAAAPRRPDRRHLPAELSGAVQLGYGGTLPFYQLLLHHHR